MVCGTERMPEEGQMVDRGTYKNKIGVYATLSCNIGHIGILSAIYAPFYTYGEIAFLGGYWWVLRAFQT